MTVKKAMKLRAEAMDVLTEELENEDPVLYTVCSTLICALDRFIDKLAHLPIPPQAQP